jgi:hypothetical protein
MKKAKLFTVLLLVSIGCIINTHVVVAATAQSKTANSHKKNKTPQNASRQRQMSEKDIAECTQLIGKVAQTDKAIQSGTLATATDNTGITERPKKSAQVQLFASDNPAAIAHLTGGAVNVVVPPASNNKVKPIVPPVSKPVARSTIPPNTQIFASDDPKAIAHLTGKITTPLTNSSPQAQSAVNKPVTHPHPHIQLFAPNTPDLENLEGKSANLANFQKNVPVDKVAKTKPKTLQKAKKATHKAEKSAPVVEVSKKPENPAIKTEKPAPAVEANKKTETPALKSLSKGKKPAPAVEANKKIQTPAPKAEKSTPAVASEKPKNSI